VDETHSFDKGLAMAGFAPLAALIVLLICWPREKADPGSSASHSGA
jgi:hypothetical protein